MWKYEERKLVWKDEGLTYSALLEFEILRLSSGENIRDRSRKQREVRLFFFLPSAPYLQCFCPALVWMSELRNA